MLPITMTMAAAAALINLWLALRIVRIRMGDRIEFGDAGDRRMIARVRSHGNFTEYTPFVLILIGLIEFARGSALWLWGVGILYIVGRLLHPLGMQRQAPNALRAGGMIITWGVLLVLAIYALFLVYTLPPPARI